MYPARTWGAGVIAVALLVAAATGAGAAPLTGVKNIVLVHGAFVDGSSWSRVIPILQARGYHVTAVQIPLTSLADDVAATKRALDREDGPTILAGHSWAGVVITEAGLDPKVVGLVYVAAFAPDQGENVADLGKAYPPPPALASPMVDAQGFLTLSEDAFQKFGSDLPVSDARLAAAVQGPINASAFAAQVSGAAWKTKPSWYIVSALDQAIAPDEERFFAKRMKATTTELKSSHVSMLSKPREVADVIMDAASKSPLPSTAEAH
jgi:pimeloyl-ACP methyl ester carboxylesterase